jgi:hypothetical protein
VAIGSDITLITWTCREQFSRLLTIAVDLHSRSYLASLGCGWVFSGIVNVRRNAGSMDAFSSSIPVGMKWDLALLPTSNMEDAERGESFEGVQYQFFVEFYFVSVLFWVSTIWLSTDDRHANSARSVFFLVQIKPFAQIASMAVSHFHLWLWALAQN